MENGTGEEQKLHGWMECARDLECLPQKPRDGVDGGE